MQSYTHLTLVEREDLRILREKGKSLREIAQELGRNVSTISRELKRNGRKDGGYTAWWGCSLYLYRRKNCRKKRRIDEDHALKEFICKGLKRYWSPELITVMWKRKHPDAKLSHSTIYAALKKKQLKGLSERDHLLRRGIRKYCRNAINVVKPEHSIHDWPQVIRERGRIGDWEGDTIRGGIGKGYIYTCIDRKSRYLTLSLMPGKRTAVETREAVAKAMKGLPVQSLTLDNGTEFADHKGISQDLNATVYFADPHSPWQRGSNEHINGVLRFFFPKGSDFRKLTQQQVDEVAHLLNSKPLKCLGWLSPLQVLRLN
jgi:IS30 family transposase